MLLFTGIGWVGSLRDCLRAVWALDDTDDGNVIVRKGKDGLLLLGLGGTALVSLAASTLGATAVGRAAEGLGVPEGGAGGVLLQTAAFAVAVLADFLLLLYLLTLLPGVEPPRHDLVRAALIGAVGFELLKMLLGGYLAGVAAKSTYGAFGVPVALLLWISLTARLLLFCAAWSATGDRRGRLPLPLRRPPPIDQERRGRHRRQHPARDGEGDPGPARPGRRSGDGGLGRLPGDPGRDPAGAVRGGAGAVPVLADLGGTSSPTGRTFPAAANPQSRSRAASL